MIKKSITFRKNLESAETVTEDFYFNLTKAEALEIGLMDDLEAVGNSNDPKAIIPVFKHIINYSHGVRLPDGGFDKDPARTRGFLASDAYSELFLGLLQEGEQGVINFINAALSFDTSEVNKLNITNPSAPKPEATRPEPQDYKKSARELAAEAAAQKEENVVDNREAKRLPEDEEEFQQWKAARDAKKAELAAQYPAEPVQADPPLATPENGTPEQTHAFFHGGVESGLVQGDNLTEIARTPIQTNVEPQAPQGVSQPAFEHQALRRDNRDQA